MVKILTEKRSIGDRGETVVVNYLIKNGYEILERNWHSRYGEIDIIASKDEYLAFVEVKTRKKNSLVSGVEAVNFAKQNKIRLTGEKYLLDNPLELQPRFDLAVVEYSGNRCNIEYYADAFE